MRFGTPGGLSPPAVFDLATTAADDVDRAGRGGATGLAGAPGPDGAVAAGRRAAAGPSPTGNPPSRPTLLPLPDEVPRRPPAARPARQAGPVWVGSVLPTRRGRADAPETTPMRRPGPTGRIASSSTTSGATSPRPGRPRRPRGPGHHPRTSAGPLEPPGADPLGPGRDGPGPRGRRIPGRGRRRARPSRRGDADRPVARAGTRLGPALGPLPRDAAGQPPAPANPQAEPTPGDRDDPMLVNPFARRTAGIELQRERGRGGAMPFAPNPAGDELELIRARARFHGSSRPARPGRSSAPASPARSRSVVGSRVSPRSKTLRFDRSEHREQHDPGALDDPGSLVGRDRPALHDVVQQGERTADHVRLGDADLQ